MDATSYNIYENKTWGMYMWREFVGRVGCDHNILYQRLESPVRVVVVVLSSWRFRIEVESHVRGTHPGETPKSADFGTVPTTPGARKDTEEENDPRWCIAVRFGGSSTSNPLKCETPVNEEKTKRNPRRRGEPSLAMTRGVGNKSRRNDKTDKCKGGIGAFKRQTTRGARFILFLLFPSMPSSGLTNTTTTTPVPTARAQPLEHMWLTVRKIARWKRKKHTQSSSSVARRHIRRRRHRKKMFLHLYC